MSIDRNQRAKIIWQAERLERATKAAGRPSGALGQSGLAILRALLFRFGDAPEPSYKAIRRVTGFAFSTISDALTRLEAAGILFIARRRRKTIRGSRVISNAYRFLKVPEKAPQPLIPADVERRFHKSLIIPFNELTGPLKAALDALGDRIMEAAAREARQ